MQLLALRSRDFRRYWIALIISAVGTWMQILAQSLLVLRLSHGNPAPLGFVALAQASAFFVFALAGGSLADRIDRRRLLIATQSILAILATVIGALVALHLIQIWMVVAGAFLSGAILSFDQPARATFLPSLVPDAHIASAISLQSVVFTGAGAVAPVLAGLWISRFGLAANFFFNAASYLLAAAVVLFLSHASGLRMGSPPAPWLRSIRQGIGAIQSDGLLKLAVSGYALLLFAAPSMQIFLPVLVVRVLHLDASTLGLLFAAFGAGAIGGAFLVPWLTNQGRPDRIYLWCFAVWVAALASIALFTSFFVLVAVLVCLGAAQGALSTFVSTLLQTRVDKNMRGRMMSLQTLLNMGIRQLGDFPLSFLLGAIGALATVAVSASLLGAFGLYLLAVMLRKPEV